MAGDEGGGEAVVELEDAVNLLFEHLVQPVLPRGAFRREAALAPDKQEIVARQVHATVILYNYFHRKQFPQLDFADPRRFTAAASLAAGEALLMYLNTVQGGGGQGTELSVTDKAIVEACGIAEALDAVVDASEMMMWPISKVAVLLVDPTRKRCLIEHGALTKGVWSILEKDVTTASETSPNRGLSSSEALPSEPYMLQQTAFSLVESETGMKRTQLRILEEHLMNSLSKKNTNTKLFVVQYDQTVNSNLKEVPLKDLIRRMSGTLFKTSPCLITSPVIECFHLLQYKDVLLNLFNRERCLDSSQSVTKEQPARKEKSSLHSEIGESLKGQEANSKSNIKAMAPSASVSKKNKLLVKEASNSDIKTCSTSKQRKNCNLSSKRKSEAIKATPATSTDHWDGEAPGKGNDSLPTPDAETSKFVSNPANAEATRAKSGTVVDLQASVQMGTENHNASKSTTQHISKVNAPEVDRIVKNRASEHQIEIDTEISGVRIAPVTSEDAVVELEDAVQLLVEHLVRPVLPQGALRKEADLAPEKQETVARQVHTTVLLYNYFHRKQFPQLDFADARRFTMSASLAAGEALLVYLNQVQDHDANRGGSEGAEPSVTDIAILEACGIAEALDAMVDTPKMIMWPISKIAILLIDPTRKRCLIEHGAMTKGVWSIPEKDVITASENLASTDLLSSDTLSFEPYMLQQTAYSLVESRTGIKRTSLRFLEEHLVYSLSKKETTTKLFVVQCDQTVNSNLKEVQLEDLISRMSGPLFKTHPFLITTSVVECYHLLPYREVLLNLLNRGSYLDSSQSGPKAQSFRKEKSSFHSEIDESLKGQEANSKASIEKMIQSASVSKKNKLIVKEAGNNDINNQSTRGNRNSNLNSKRKSEIIKASAVTSTEHRHGETPREGNDSLSIPDVETLKFVSNSANAEAKRAKGGGVVNLQASVQMGAENHNAPEVDPRVMIHASESQIETGTEISGNATNNINDQMYASLQSLQKMRDDILREHCMLGDRSAQFDMDIQAILTEGKMTPRVMSILEKYENNSLNVMRVASPTNSGEGSQTMNMKRKRLTEAILFRNKCQELDEICRENNWILPRYTVLPSVIDGFYQASVHLICPDLEMRVNGDMKTTPREARDSAATNLLYQLRMKAKEKIAEQSSSTPDAAR